MTTREVSSGLGGLGCSELTTEEARTFVEDLEDAGIEGAGAGNPYRLDFHFDASGPTADVIVIWFEPYLPDDRWPWSTSG